MLVATPMAVLPIPMTTWYRTTWTFWGWSSACVPWCCVWSGQPGWPFTVPASLSPTRNWTTIPSKSCRVLCFPSLQLSCLICKIRLPWLCREQLESLENKGNFTLFKKNHSTRAMFFQGIFENKIRWCPFFFYISHYLATTKSQLNATTICSFSRYSIIIRISYSSSSIFFFNRHSK